LAAYGQVTKGFMSSAKYIKDTMRVVACTGSIAIATVNFVIVQLLDQDIKT